MIPKIHVVQADITAMDVDVVVNAANRAMRGGGGVDGAIHRAGGPSVLADCIKRFPDGLEVGDAGWTTAGDMPARWVVHTVGPNYGAGVTDPSLLRSCYRNALTVAADIGAESIAFPLISAGTYRWPLDDAVTIAMDEIVRTPAAVRDVHLVALHPEATARLEKWVSEESGYAYAPFRILEAVGLLHQAGYQQIRVLAGIGGPGCWRAQISAAEHIDDQSEYPSVRPGTPDSSWLRYTSGGGGEFEGTTITSTTDPMEVAHTILARLPGVKRAVADPEYARWYAGLLRLVERRRAHPVAYGDDQDSKLGWEVGEALYPSPPPARA